MQLSSIQPMVQQIAEAVAAVLKVEVEIADDQLLRVAGTGKSKENVLNSMAGEDFVYRHTMRSGQPMLIRNPGFEEICRPCVHFQNCQETGEISCPIMADGTCVGIIGLLAFDQEQRRRLFEHEEIILNFLEKIADLIASKLKEHKIYQDQQATLKTLITVMNYLDQGVVAIDKKMNILHFNSRAKQYLHMEHIETDEQLNAEFRQNLERIQEVTAGANDPREVLLWADGKWKSYITSYTPIEVGDRNMGAVITVDDINKMVTLARQFTDLEEIDPFTIIIGNSQAIVRTIETAKKVATSDSTVLILGESGTGKELFAKAIHQQSYRNKNQFVSINCGAIPEQLLESELFGYEEGAFTGAKKGGKMGKFEQADGGTLFLDEIGDMPLHLQVKLLRVLQEKQVERIGNVKGGKPINARVIAATNRNLEELVAKGEFREDLYYRLNVIPLTLPPLRERREDILTIANHFLNYYAGQLKKEMKGFSVEAQNVMLDYNWPGNVRELANLVEYAVNMETSPYISMKNLPERICSDNISRRLADQQTGTTEMEDLHLGQLEKKAIARALQIVAERNQPKDSAAQLLGISRATLFRKIKEYNMS